MVSFEEQTFVRKYINYLEMIGVNQNTTYKLMQCSAGC